jgi:hypothetical protein
MVLENTPEKKSRTGRDRGREKEGIKKERKKKRREGKGGRKDLGIATKKPESWPLSSRTERLMLCC